MKRIAMLLMFPIAAPIRLLFVSRDGKQTFWGRVGVFVVGSLLLSVINGNITIHAIWAACRYLAMLCALILHYFGGYEVRPPKDVQNQGQDIIGRIEAEAQEVKRKAAEAAAKAEAKLRQDIHDAEMKMLKEKHDMEAEAIRIREAAEEKARIKREELENKLLAKREEAEEKIRQTAQKAASKMNPFAGLFTPAEETIDLYCPNQGCRHLNKFRKESSGSQAKCGNCFRNFALVGIGNVANFKPIAPGVKVPASCPNCHGPAVLIGDGQSDKTTCRGCKVTEYTADWIEDFKINGKDKAAFMRVCSQCSWAAEKITYADYSSPNYICTQCRKVNSLLNSSPTKP